MPLGIQPRQGYDKKAIKVKSTKKAERRAQKWRTSEKHKSYKKLNQRQMCAHPKRIQSATLSCLYAAAITTR